MPPPAWTVPPATNATGSALLMKPLAEVACVELAAGDDLIPLAADEARRLEAMDQQFVAAAAPFDHLPQGSDQLGLALQAKQVIAQMVAERPGVLARFVEQLVERAGWRAAGELVERLAHEVGVATDERVEPLDGAAVERPRVQGVEAKDLVGLEVLQRQDHADIERRLVRSLDEELRLGGRGEHDVQLLPAAAERVGAQAVPAPQHGEEIVGEIRAEDRVRLVDRQYARRAQRLQDLAFDV